MNKHSRDLVKLDFLKYLCLWRVMNWILSVVMFYLNAGKLARYTVHAQKFISNFCCVELKSNFSP